MRITLRPKRNPVSANHGPVPALPKTSGCVLATVLLLLALVPSSGLSQSPITIRAETIALGAPISSTFIGLSFETQKMLPESNGGYFFSPTNRTLLTLFHTLGIRSLRIGGNTADRPSVNVPGNKDIDSLFGFAKAADAKVIYTLRLREGNMTQAAELAKYINEHYKAQLACFAIGNEPNMFAKEYPSYRDTWKQYADAITASGIAPDAKFCGPSATPGKAAWARDFIKDFGASGKIAFVTQHDYPGGAGNRATNVVAARDKMLSQDWLKGYQKFFDSFAADALSNHLAYRIEEANSFYNGGATDVSDTFAAALWALDYLHWWAAHDAAGINFHTGDQVAAGEKMNPCRYATFWTSPAGYNVHPIGYGIKGFDLGSHGRVVALKTGNPDGLNLTAYGALADDSSLYITIINKEHGQKGRGAQVVLDAAPGWFDSASYTKAKTISLVAPANDVAVTAGVSLGGAG